VNVMLSTPWPKMLTGVASSNVNETVPSTVAIGPGTKVPSSSKPLKLKSMVYVISAACAGVARALTQ